MYLVATSECITILKDHHDSVYSVNFSRNGAFLATAARDMSVQLYRAATTEKVKMLSGLSHATYAVAFSTDGSTLASASGDSQVHPLLHSQWGNGGNDAMGAVVHRDWELLVNDDGLHHRFTAPREHPSPTSPMPISLTGATVQHGCSDMRACARRAYRCCHLVGLLVDWHNPRHSLA